MAPPNNIRPLTIQELNALLFRVVQNEGYPNVLSDIEYHKDEFVQPRAQEYIVRIRQYLDRGAPEDLFRIKTGLRFLLRTKINPIESLMPVDNIFPPLPAAGGRRRKVRKTRSRTKTRTKTRSRR